MPSWFGKQKGSTEEEPRSAGEVGVLYTEYAQTVAERGRSAPYVVNLHLAGSPSLDAQDLVETIRRRSGLAVDVVSPSEPMLVAFPEMLSEIEGKPAPFALMVATGGQGQAAQLEPALGQTWDWPEARSALAAAPNVVVVMDFLGALFDPSVRFPAVHAGLGALVELLQPVAIDWAPAQRIVKPETYLAATGDDLELFGIMVNVRMTRIENTSPAAFVMDTMGMAHFGLPDVQIHFNDPRLDPGRVAGFTKNVAAYLRERGDIIHDGETVDGIVEGERWHCRHELALIGPTRVVLDVDPASHGPVRRNR